MAITVLAPMPNTLLKEIYHAIDIGKIKTWDYDEAKRFTHTADQWINKAWFKPVIKDKTLQLYIVGPEGAGVPVEIYAIYHGRFIEMLLAHFREKFTNASASAKPNIKTPAP